MLKSKKENRSELNTLECDIPNPDYLIWVSNRHTCDFLLKRILSWI